MKAVRLAGSQTALAELFGVSPQAVQKWVAQGFAPGDRCREIESMLEGAVTRYELNPDIFGEPSEARPRRATDPEPEPGRAGRTPVSRDRIMTVAIEQPVLFDRRAAPANPK